MVTFLLLLMMAVRVCLSLATTAIQFQIIYKQPQLSPTSQALADPMIGCQNALRVELLSLSAETQTWRAWRLRFLVVFKDFHNLLEFHRFEQFT